VESYDGKTIYYSEFDGAGLWSVPVDGGEEMLVSRTLHHGYWGHFAVTEFTCLMRIGKRAQPSCFLPSSRGAFRPYLR
jgi:hypothetical protein